MMQTRVEARPLPPRPRSKAAEIEERVRRALAERKTVTRDVEAELAEKVTLGERVADAVAEFGGSWTFILSFMAAMTGWIILNSAFLVDRAFDPFPYSLLNVALSTLAALQAPVILMSQNRQASKDRVRAEHDYEVNLKSEIEIGQVHKKLDDLREGRWRDLLELQRRQIEYLERLAASGGGGRTPAAP
jgi:uncharacterized membrane protein